MQDKKGIELKVGDIVDIDSRKIEGFGTFSRGIVGRIDKYAYTQNVLVVGDNGGMPMPLACCYNSLTVIEPSISDKILYGKLKQIYDQMTEDIQKA